NQQESGLDCIQPPVIAFDVVVVLHCLSMIADHLYLLRQARIVRSDCARLPTGPQILAWVKAECRRPAHRAGLHPAIALAGKIFSAVGLAGVFDHDEIVLLRNLKNRIHVGSLAIKMYRNYRRYRTPTPFTYKPA